ncbi:HlyD family efflux transporter periplasmic adaptor subunit [Rhizobium laguerreae]|uniref:HlyD family efflux transporter periplasmic adaptor subunit n=1 Tax=Rhizobium laguerreae TaxID=1076926 RepID=UPI001C90D9EE|nr:HlyD family efflux transporter periplasmic adaptor subunit [Rhizobium laguerreae]MBY3384009.1 HlyD family efflux transporter periplasmic adaptor subunit [Rhizobium laguerreae]
MTATLFRTIQPDNQAIPGLLDLRSPALAVLTAFLVGSVLLATVFVGAMPYSRRQPAIGLVVSDAGTVRVMPPQPATLQALFVADGALVEAGEPLFSVSYTTSLQDGGTLQGSLSRSLDRQQALLLEQIAGESIRVDHERSGFDNRIAALEAERESLHSQRALLEQRVRVASDQFQSGDSLRQRGLTTDTDLRAREDALLARQQELTTVQQRLDSNSHEERQVALLRAQLPADSRDRIARLDGTVAALQQQKAEAAARDGAIVRSPVKGRVTALQATVGQQVDPNKPLMSLVPNEVTMHAELFVSPQEIGFLRPAQSVRLTYDAFPFQRFGAQAGVVERISETMLAPEEVSGPVRPQGPAYLVTVRLDKQHVAEGGREQMLWPDMTLRAEIILERRTVLDWILEPLRTIMGRTYP